MTSFWAALGGAAVLTGLLVPVLRRTQSLDIPNHRSSHVVPTPRGGGLAVMAAVVLGVVVVKTTDAWPLLAAALLLALVGFADDLRSLSPAVRLVAQSLGGAALSVWVAVDLGTAGLWAPLFVAISFTGIISYVNAFNFMDGVNGISALNAAVAGAWFVWMGHSHGLAMLEVTGWALAGAALGFLPWNAAGRVFLGDVGSYGLGLLIAGGTVVAWSIGVPGPVALVPLLIYLTDTAWVILKRLSSGERLGEAHRGHVYQRLADRWGSHIGSAGLAAAGSAACCLSAALLPTIPAVVSVALLAIGYLTVPWFIDAVSPPAGEAAS